MKTVKEISNITGISVRTLHYYDEIGLLKPTDKSDAGYRLYDDKALEQLQQILFFREFDIPLLKMQREMLLTKIQRMEHLVASIDDILKGENKMDFAIFNKTELDEMFQAMTEHMPEEIKQKAIDEFGGLNQWHEHYIKAISSDDMQKHYRKMVEWFGGKEQYLATVKNPISKEVVASYQKRMDAVLEKLAGKRKCPVDSFEVKEIIGKYGFVMKQLYQLQDESGMMLSLAETYRREEVKKSTDEKYGDGAAQFFMQALEAFYK